MEVNSRELFDQTKSNLQQNNNYDSFELQSLTFWVLEECFGLSKTDILGAKSIDLNNSQKSRLNDVLEKLHKNVPIQYIVGEVEFFNRIFKVNPSVLIPRPETEELVDIIIRFYQGENFISPLKILDIGTGSGCIAISLALELEIAQTFALDISKDALHTAQENASLLEADIQFIQENILSPSQESPLHEHYFDTIISNPPYVRSSEKSMMYPNVLLYEPNQAIFVEDSQPLVFYQAITEYASTHLKPGGKLYFEINEAFGIEVRSLLEQAGFTNVKIHQDIQQKDRFVEGTKPTP